MDFTVLIGDRKIGAQSSLDAVLELLPDARFVAVPGNHMSAVIRPELGQAIADFLE